MWQKIAITLLIVLIVLQMVCIFNSSKSEGYKYDSMKSKQLAEQVGTTLHDLTSDMHHAFLGTSELIGQHSSAFVGIAKFLKQFNQLAKSIGIDMTKLHDDLDAIGRTGINLFAESGAFEFVRFDGKPVDDIGQFPFSLKSIKHDRILNKNELIEMCMNYAGSQNMGTIDENIHQSINDFVKNQIHRGIKPAINDFANWAVDPSPTPWNVSQFPQQMKKMMTLLNRPEIHELFHEYAQILERHNLPLKNLGDALFDPKNEMKMMMYKETAHSFGSNADFGLFVMYMFYRGGLVPQSN